MPSSRFALCATVGHPVWEHNCEFYNDKQRQEWREAIDRSLDFRYQRDVALESLERMKRSHSLNWEVLQETRAQLADAQEQILRANRMIQNLYKDVTRIAVIDHRRDDSELGVQGLVVSAWGVQVTHDIQDRGRTLKIWIKDRDATQEET